MDFNREGPSVGGKRRLENRVQYTIFSGFARDSQTDEVLSKSLDNDPIMSGSISKRGERNQSIFAEDGTSAYDAGQTEIYPEREICRDKNWHTSYVDKAAVVSQWEDYLWKYAVNSSSLSV